MTNKDKFLRDEADINELCYELSSYCTRINFNGFTARKLEEFFNKPIQPTLTEDERVILRNLKVEKYIFRDSYGDLLISETKPTENEIRCGDLGYVFDIYNHLFQFIKERRRVFY